MMNLLNGVKNRMGKTRDQILARRAETARARYRKKFPVGRPRKKGSGIYPRLVNRVSEFKNREFEEKLIAKFKEKGWD